MAKNSIRDFDNTAGNNTDIQSVDISEGCSPAGINNAIREVMADLADVNDGTVALESPQADSLTVTGDLTVDTDTLKVDSTNNRVGIGTSLPSKDLHIKTTTADNQIRVEASGGNLNVGNDNTGSYVESSGSRPLRTFVGGSERMRITSNGELLQGTTTSPTSPSVNYTSRVASGGNYLQASSGSNGGAIFGTGGSGDFKIWTHTGDIGSESYAQRMVIDSSGRLFVNTTSTTNYGQTSGDDSWMYRTEEGATIQAQDADGGFAMMYMNKFDWNSSKDGRYVTFYKNGGALASIGLTSGGLISYGTGSDYRLKENVTDMTGGITRIKQINPKQFNLIVDPDDTTMDGFLAHELATVIPEAVVGTHNGVKSRTNVVRNADGNFIEDGVTQGEWTQGKTDGAYPSDSTWAASWDEPIYQTVDYGKVTPLLVAALQEAITKIETLETENADFETRIAALEAN